MSWSPDAYELIDFGGGRKLERFGSYLVDRPAPVTAEMARGNPEAWRRVDARYERRAGGKGAWSVVRQPPAPWVVGGQGPLCLELKLTPFGHVGVFPEQVNYWGWIAEQVRRAETPLKVLNLFGYTGGSTLAAAAVGAEVVHVDAARNTVAWARENARRSGLGEAPIRWITEDAVKFVRREIRRGNRYHAVILDPPSYGHGPQGEAWRLERDLSGLLQSCAALIEPDPRWLLLTCHSTGYDRPLLKRLLQGVLPRTEQRKIRTAAMWLRTSEDRPLAAGAAVYWSSIGR